MPTQNLMKFEIEEEFDDIRIDKVLSEYLSDLSRTYIQKIISGGRVTVASVPVKANYKVSAGQEITVDLPEPETLGKAFIASSQSVRICAVSAPAFVIRLGINPSPSLTRAQSRWIGSTL